MKKMGLIILMVASQMLFAFEPDALNLTVPSNLEPKSLVFAVRHRFYGELTEDPFDTFFGLDLGANVHLGLRFAILSRLELNASYTRSQKEYVIGASYAHHFSQIFLRAHLDAQFFDFELAGARQNNFFLGLALQTDPIFGRILPVANVGYDGYNERIGFGFGLDIGFDIEFGPIEHISLLGEYLPVVNRDLMVNGPYNYFAGGLRIDSYGHHFMILVGNGQQIGVRRLMLGADTNDLYLGFNIQRILRF